MTDTQDKVISTGYTELDNLLNGGLHNDLVIIKNNHTGMGKTTLALNLAKNFFSKSDCNNTVLFFSFEMQERDILDRYISNTSGVPYGTLLSARLNKKQLNDFNQVTDKALAGLNRCFILCEPLNIHHIEDYIIRYKRCKNLGLVVIDKLNDIECEKHIDTPYDTDIRTYLLARNAIFLSLIAKEMNIPIITTMYSEDSVSDKVINEVADVILRINHRTETEIEITADKYRHPKFTLKVDWPRWRFTNPE